MPINYSNFVCDVCGKSIGGNRGALTSHLRRHAREGVLVELPNSDFVAVTYNYWGWVSEILPEFVIIKTHGRRYFTRILKRFQVGGIVQVGDAVRLEFKYTKDNKKRGIWYAHPLGYKADWKTK